VVKHRHRNCCPVLVASCRFFSIHTLLKGTMSPDCAERLLIGRVANPDQLGSVNLAGSGSGLKTSVMEMDPDPTYYRGFLYLFH
jgi:hypothetical protein